MSDWPWRIEPFDKRLHHRQGFDCGNAELNDWLETKISQYQQRDLWRAFVLLPTDGDRVVGYYALSSHSIVFDSLPQQQAKGLPRSDVPVILLGRLAVDRNHKGQGLGEFLLIDALRRCSVIAEQTGTRAVEVDAIDEDAKSFYLKYGFIPLQDDPRHLFLAMKTIRKLKLD